MSRDGELLAAWRDGDGRAGEALFDRYFDVLHRFFRNKVGAECEDLVQRTMVACVEKQASFAGHSSFRTWMLGVARVELLHHYREKGRATAREAELSETAAYDLDPSPSAVIARNQEERVLLEALRRLPLDLQIALELHYWEHLAMAEIAFVLGVPEGTAKSRMRRARERLEQSIRALAADPEVMESTVMDLDRWAEGLRDALQR